METETGINSRASIKKTSILAIITNNRFINIVCLFIITSSAFMIYRRIVYNWSHTQEQVNTVSNIHALSMGIPFYFLIIAYAALHNPNLKIIDTFNKLTDIRVVSIISITAIIASTILLIIDYPTILGTWTSVSMVFASLLICVSILRNKLSNILAFISGVAITGIWIGLWEIPYQTALKLIYDMPQIGTALVIRWIAWEWMIEFLTAGCSIWILIAINNKYHILNFNKYFYILIGTYVILITIWITTGFWVDVWYNWKQNTWIQTPYFNKWIMFVYKASKAVMLLAFISLLRNRNESTQYITR